MRHAFRILILCLALFAQYVLAADSARNLSVSAADAPANDRRIALVIGNSAYKSSPLANPVNDARAIGTKLRALGFTVIERENLKFKDIGATLREFRSKLVPGGVALFFYAGHGIQVQGVNYLPVVDADIASEEDVSLQSLEVGKVLSLMDDAKTRLNLVFLDACRNNPFARSFRSAGDGLARVSAPTGTLISFATRPGSVAADGTGRNGLYTEQLLTAMDLRGQPIELALKRVVSGVKAASKGRQEPWMEGSIEGDFCFGGCLASGIAAPAAPLAVDPSANDRTFWESVKDSRNPDELNAYLAQYPDGLFASLARSRLRAVADAPQLASAVPTLHAQGNTVPQGVGSATMPPLTGNPRVELATSLGPIVIELYPEKAPKSVENFVQYVRDGFYNGMTFHRVIDGFMIQGGGFEPGMREKPAHAPIPNEAKNGLTNDSGTIAVARARDPNSGSSQFFINLVNNSRLNYPSFDGWGYAVFGKVVSGMDTVRAIGKVPTGSFGNFQDVPTTPVVIEAARVVN